MDARSGSRLLAGLLIVAAALLLAPPLGLAYTVRVSRHLDSSEPQFNGERLVWTQAGSNRELLIRAAPLRPRARVSTLYTFANPPSALHNSVEVGGLLAASPTAVAIRGTQFSEDGGDLTAFRDLGLVAGFRRGPVRRLAAPPDNCGSFGGQCGLEPLTIDGDRLVVRRDAASITTLDARTGGQRVVPVVGSFAGLRGRFLVSTLPSQMPLDRQVIVYDTAAQREVYRVNVHNYQSVLDVQPDGKVILGVGIALTRLAWTGPTAPTVHMIHARRVVGGSYKAIAQNDRVVFSRPGLKGDDEVGVVALRGSGSRILARTANGFDFDGRRVAWTQRGCREASLEVATLRQLERRPAITPSCRLGLEGSVGLARNSTLPTLAFTLACDGFDEDCEGTRVVLTAARAYRLGGTRVPKGAVLARASHAGNEGLGHRARLTLNRLGGRLLRSRARTRVTLSMRVGGAGYPRRSVTVVARRGR